MIEQGHWRALGTGAHLLVSDGDLRVARQAVEAVLADVDATYSRFRSDSELTCLNALAGETVRVSDLLARAVGTALRAAELTDGLVDPTVGRAVRASGYDMDFSHVAGGGDRLVVRIERIPGWRTVRLDRAARTVCLAPGVELDLGSTGKAFAAELAASAAAARLGPGAGVLVSLGGDIALAGTAPRAGWQVAIAEDSGTDTDTADEVVSLAAGGLATSSTTVRRWRRRGADLHHIVDPRTGAPAAGPWRTAAVVAGTCVDANAAATAAIIRGDSAPAWLASVGLDARLVATDGTIRYVGRWPVPAPSTIGRERGAA